ncbi:MAG: hypothetical protein BWY09_00046 [Candidatus Hydrogenedentes bacterium ADurb.Bin179]|nr:MAG: hypothetical protein BWY09_00046 [Candidatus Hydrogenedentes bacterium ADurb.Bin179]
MRSVAFSDTAEGKGRSRGDEILAACLVQEGHGASCPVQFPSDKFRFHHGAFREGRRQGDDGDQENTQND